ncbi:hypothetical protein, partial [Streptomyces sp. NPDC021608]|uniref:hypothetical protein n=1 Tax=Streptomyces sp. NPDC021608 TaxID=3154903 RepID=UPI0033E1AFFC
MSEVQHDGLGPGGKFVRQVTAARVGGVVLHPDHGELDDLVDVAGTQQDRVAGVEQLGLAVLPQPVEATLDVVEPEVPVTMRVDQMGGERQVVRARLPGLLRLAQRVLRRYAAMTTGPSVSAPGGGGVGFWALRPPWARRVRDGSTMAADRAAEQGV